MRAIFENVIRAGGYKLAEMQRKIKQAWAENDLSESDKVALLNMAAGHASVNGEKPNDDARFTSLLQYIHALEDRVETLEEAVLKSEDGDTSEVPEEDKVVYEKWTPWDGISNKYQSGAVVSHNGKVWESTFAGQNVWEPGAPGTEAMWKLVEET